MERLLPPLHRSLAFIVLASTSGSPAADGTGREQKRTKAGYHHGDGILPFVLRDQVRFVRTWSPPYMAALGATAAYVRTGSPYTSGEV